jgi:hypothetical protein
LRECSLIEEDVQPLLPLCESKRQPVARPDIHVSNIVFPVGAETDRQGDLVVRRGTGQNRDRELEDLLGQFLVASFQSGKLAEMIQEITPELSH